MILEFHRVRARSSVLSANMGVGERRGFEANMTLDDMGHSLGIGGVARTGRKIERGRRGFGEIKVVTVTLNFMLGS